MKLYFAYDIWTLKEYFTIMSSQDVFYYLIVAMNVYLTGN